MAIQADGSLWTWGFNDFGQLGDGTTEHRLAPMIRVGADNHWASVAAGAGHTVAIRADGSLWAWGANWNGQLGDGTTEDRLSPVRVGSDNNWASVSVGMIHTVAVRTDGSLWAWGSGWLGRFGDGSNEDIIHLTPVKIMEDVVSVSAGVSHTVAIKADGSL